jgi:WbqC-like protein family
MGRIRFTGKRDDLDGGMLLRPRLRISILIDAGEINIARYGSKMAKRVAILQSSYIPWKGYFDIIRSVDECILLDTVQYTRRDWRNRNKIKSPNGPMWLTIPVANKGKYTQNICDTVISDDGWAERHWRTISHFYSKARCFPEFKSLVEELYLGSDQRSLSQINHRFLSGLCRALGIQTEFTWAMDYAPEGAKTERLISLCRQAGAGMYISGPSAQAYIDPELFAQAGIELRYVQYAGYPEYRQMYPPFVHELSILDLLLNEGSDALKFMKDVTACG